ncbi:hypothetical protein [Yersinia pekkanenii]|uniref:Uncharacterized protein n=1 Tax=Yersinia pekkanenii TaxID=1288385 RepID=A0A0T9RKL7_9GAMM|nr:hypothetical protein [Yersinia pekkanenii]CNI66325.1 Uncharacterised protein [Yersinia pekkanenii]CRY69530.1 Uncharacterised protein [Yersinia pekkanenii]
MKKKKQGTRSHHQAINIDELVDEMPEAVLKKLHDRVVNRLNMLQRQRTMQSMADFRPGDVVRFQTDEREISGVLIRLNKKSVTVHTENGNRWNVAPQLLTLVKRPLTLEALDRALLQIAI